MKRLIKILTIPLILLFTFSLYGCGTANVDQSKEKVVNIADGAKPTVNQPEQPKTEEAEPTQPSASTENQTAQPEEQPKQTTKAAADSGQSESKSGTNKDITVTKNPAPSAVVPSKSPEPKKTEATAATKPTSSNTSTTKPQPKTEPISTVSLTIKGPKEYGSILSDSKISMKNGEVILTVLLREAKARNIHVDYRGSGATAYVQGMEDNGGKWSFYEFDYGATSGFVFKLNGVSLTQSIGITTIKNGDHIECIYTE